MFAMFLSRAHVTEWAEYSFFCPEDWIDCTEMFLAQWKGLLSQYLQHNQGNVKSLACDYDNNKKSRLSSWKAQEYENLYAHSLYKLIATVDKD